LVEINTMNDVLTISKELVGQTLTALRHAGSLRHEGVALWLGRRNSEHDVRVVEVYVPEHESSGDFFRIPPDSMSTLLRHLGDTNTLIAAQVHSHPFEAFHSEADNRWAIVRHLGALSVVVPYFADSTNVSTFLADCAAFRLSKSNTWDELSDSDRFATFTYE
jgi:proteasome lid subunit RPN8/RPN11